MRRKSEKCSNLNFPDFLEDLATLYWSVIDDFQSIKTSSNARTKFMICFNQCHILQKIQVNDQWKVEKKKWNLEMVYSNVYPRLNPTGRLQTVCVYDLCRHIPFTAILADDLCSLCFFPSSTLSFALSSLLFVRSLWWLSCE